MNVEITEHARMQMVERGVVEGEVKTAIEQGPPESARLGRTMYRKNFPFDSNWRGRDYRTQTGGAGGRRGE